MGRKALGRGLEALIPGETERIENISVDKIEHSSYQPRMRFSEEKLNELARSIKEQGIMQPVLVRETKKGFELVYGHRRFEAAKLAGLEIIPAVIKDISDRELLEIALIENVQREDLNPVDEAKAYHRLNTEFGLTQENIAKRVGKDRSTITNRIRLLSLPENVLNALSSGKITEGHARALLSLKDKSVIERELKRILKQKKTVRAVERRTKSVNPYIVQIENELSVLFGTKIKIIKGRKKGRIEIEFYSNNDLERILEMLKRSNK